MRSYYQLYLSDIIVTGHKQYRRNCRDTHHTTLSINPWSSVLVMMCMLLLFGSSSSLELEIGIPLTLGLDIILLITGMYHPSSKFFDIYKAMDRFPDRVNSDDSKAGLEPWDRSKWSPLLMPSLVSNGILGTSIQWDILWSRQIRKSSGIYLRPIDWDPWLVVELLGSQSWSLTK